MVGHMAAASSTSLSCHPLPFANAICSPKVTLQLGAEVNPGSINWQCLYLRQQGVLSSRGRVGTPEAWVKAKPEVELVGEGRVPG